MPGFDYFRAADTEQFAFYRIPKALFTDKTFGKLSCEAKVLYGLMLDRICLSIRNNWIDDDGHAYIIFQSDEISELMGCGRQKTFKLLAELDTDGGIGLIERCRRGQGKVSINGNEFLMAVFLRQDLDHLRSSGVNVAGAGH